MSDVIREKSKRINRRNLIIDFVFGFVLGIVAGVCAAIVDALALKDALYISLVGVVRAVLFGRRFWNFIRRYFIA
jgi:hypothetical protein